MVRRMQVGGCGCEGAVFRTMPIQGAISKVWQRQAGHALWDGLQ